MSLRSFFLQTVMTTTCPNKHNFFFISFCCAHGSMRRLVHILNYFKSMGKRMKKKKNTGNNSDNKVIYI